MRRPPPTVASGVVLVLALVLAGCGSPPVSHTGTGPDTGGSHTWESGASGAGVADGSFGRWRGDAADIAGTWNDDAAGQVHQWTLAPGGEYAAWRGDLDVAVGGIYPAAGESWAAAAQGAYDDRWRATLETLKTDWAGHTGTLYLRFAHEFNGEWEPWAVHGTQVADFKAAWDRFRALQQEVFPASKLVFCPTSETSASLDLDWRAAYPGSDEVDVVSVDYYNQYPFLADQGSFESELTVTDDHGAPRGLEAYREFAQARGVPFAISEWSTNGTMGDGTAFLQDFHDWLSTHAGTGPGQVIYEVEFNVADFGDGQFQLYPDTDQPPAAATYRSLW